MARANQRGAASPSLALRAEIQGMRDLRDRAAAFDKIQNFRRSSDG
jgi:hypothetical protein